MVIFNMVSSCLRFLSDYTHIELCKFTCLSCAPKLKFAARCVFSTKSELKRCVVSRLRFDLLSYTYVLCNSTDDAGKLDMAGGGGENPDAVSDAAIAMATAAIAGEGDVIDVPIDENLFDDDELLDIENELETLDLE